MASAEKQQAKPLVVHIRWMPRRDMTRVLGIEERCFEFPWSEMDFVRCLRNRNAIGMVVEHDGNVIGFVIYELHKERLHILNMAVHPDYQRQGVGRAIVAKLTSKLEHDRRNRILLEVRESNLTALAFLRHCGFEAKRIMPNFYQETTDDAYLMEYRL